MLYWVVALSDYQLKYIMIGFLENWAKSMHFTGHYTYSVWSITVGHWIFAAQDCLINNNWSASQPAKEIRSGYNYAFCGCAFLAYQLAVFTSFAIASKFNVNNYGSILAWTPFFFLHFLFYFIFLLLLLFIFFIFCCCCFLTGHSSFLLSLFLCILASSFSL